MGTHRIAASGDVPGEEPVIESGHVAKALQRGLGLAVMAPALCIAGSLCAQPQTTGLYDPPPPDTGSLSKSRLQVPHGRDRFLGSERSGKEVIEAPNIPVAPEEDAIADMPDNEWLVVPFASYSPETHLGVGAVVSYVYRFSGEPAESRPSSATAVGMYTTRGQAVAELLPEFYVDNNQTHIWNKIEYRNFPDSFWGIGNDTPDSNEERWNEHTFRLRSWARRKIVERLYLGGRVDLHYLRVEDTKVGGLFANEQLVGRDGGWTSGLGVTVGWDARDSAIRALEGGFYQIELMGWNRFIGSEYDFFKITADVRQFIPLGEDHALGAQFYAEIAGGNVPFHYMGMLGGNERMRGYFKGRYRDKTMWTAQVEYRSPLLWRFSGVLFAATGGVANDIASFRAEDTKWAVGGGLRWLLDEDERINLRADIGFSLETFGAYVNVSEAF